MKWQLLFFSLFAVTVSCIAIACKGSEPPQELNNSGHQYAEEDLISFLDSVGKLDPEMLSIGLSSFVDSTLINQLQLDSELNNAAFEELKSAAKQGFITVDVANKIFPKFLLDSGLVNDAENKMLPIDFFSFDQSVNDFNEFAISIGNSTGLYADNIMYFFKSNKIIAKHSIFHRYGLELKHFKNEVNQTIIYYKVNYGSGSGTWWNQFNFYVYNNDSLLPALTEIENINLQFPWSIRAYWIESTISNTLPLTIKFSFYNQFADDLDNPINFISDSTEVKYSYNANNNTYTPAFTGSKLSRLKLLTYFHADNELLFVNLNYDLLKEQIDRTGSKERAAILAYLNNLKNSISSR